MINKNFKKSILVRIEEKIAQGKWMIQKIQNIKVEWCPSSNPKYKKYPSWMMESNANNYDEIILRIIELNNELKDFKLKRENQKLKVGKMKD